MADPSVPGFGSWFLDFGAGAVLFLWHTFGFGLLVGLVLYGAVLLVRAVARARLGRGGETPSVRSEEETQLRQTILVVALMAAVLYNARSLLWQHSQTVIIVGGVIVLGAIAVAAWFAYRRSSRLCQHRVGALALPEKLCQMDRRDFEIACAELLSKLGYQVELSPARPEGPADLLLENGGVVTLAHCLNYLSRHRVGAPELENLIHSTRQHRADQALLITTGELTGLAWDTLEVLSTVNVWKRRDLSARVQEAITRLEAEARQPTPHHLG